MSDDEDAGRRIDAYLETLDPPFRQALERLRATIRAAAPQADEIITYAMPGIGWHGPVVSYFAFKRHCSLFPMGNSVFIGMEDEIAPWRTSKGTLQFVPDDPLPDALVRRIVAARLAENEAKAAARQKKGRRRS
jgi:Uncharacterized conserved protein